MTAVRPPVEVVLRERLDRPRLLRLVIRAQSISADQSVPADGPVPAHGVVARVEGGFLVAGPPPTPFHTVALWASGPPYAVAVGCEPTEANAAVEIWIVRAGAAGAAPAATRVERYGDLVTLTVATSAGEAEFVVDALWEDA